ncbi:MAG: lytic transglycosylase domain-containing protein [Tannerellaceae bacterium]|nr:lytic transglycosylase domain-containing protein [Tannerellaceae bacterium]
MEMRLSKNNVFSFVVAALVCFTTCVSMSSNDTEKARAEGDDQVLVAAIITPHTPASVMFCGEEVDLTRYNRHESFDRELTSFSYLHATTLLLFKRANRYFPIIEPILKENGIPDDFKYLAVIESHLDPRVSSPAKAVGMWQFLETTGKEFGLTVTPTVDERSHVEKSTVAACKYLNSAYKRYGNWINVAASYNAGMGRISGEITQQQVDSALEMWLVEETSRYVYRIMAIKQIFENPSAYGFNIKPQDLYKPVVTEDVKVSQDIPDLAAFAKGYNIDYADLKRFNTWLRDRKLVTGGKTYTIQIPQISDMYYKTPNTYVHDPRWVGK